MPGTQRAARAGKFSQAMQQRVHQRAARVARAGVDHHPGGLVHDDEIVVHQQQFERQIFRRGHQRGPGQDFDFDGFPGRNPMGGLGDVRRRLARCLRGSVPECACGLAPGRARATKQIQAAAGVARRGGQFLL